MHIGFLCHEYPPYVDGGLGRYAERITRFLATGNHNVAVFTMRIPGRGGDQAAAARDLPEPRSADARISVDRVALPTLLRERLPARVVQSPMINMLNQGLGYLLYNAHVLRLLAKRARKQDFDVIAVHDWMSTPAGIASALLLRKNVVFHVHSNEVSTGLWKRGAPVIERLVRWAEDLQHQLAGRVIVPSHEALEVLAQRGWSRTKLTVIPHGFEDDVFSAYQELSARASATIVAELRARLGLCPTDRVIVFVGRLVEHKGIRTLLRAFAQVCERRDGVRLVLVGTGMHNSTDNRDVQKEIERLGIVDKVIAYYRFLSKDEVAKHLLLADVCAFPSKYEPFGLVALEAMILGKATILGSGFSSLISRLDEEVVATLDPEARAVVAGQAALTMSGDDPDELAGHIDTILDDPVLASNLGAAAREHVKRRFCWEQAVTSTLRAYSEASGGRATGN